MIIKSGREIAKTQTRAIRDWRLNRWLKKLALVALRGASGVKLSQIHLSDLGFPKRLGSVQIGSRSTGLRSSG